MDKVWGAEYWIVNYPMYCAKILLLKPQFTGSLHRHKYKEETFIVLSGECHFCLMGGRSKLLRPGHRVQIGPGTAHQFWNQSEEDCVILEVSTHHSDCDVERITESGPLHQRERADD